MPRWADRLNWGEAARRREVDEALALLDAIVEQAPVGLACLDTELRYTRINDALLALAGAEREADRGDRGEGAREAPEGKGALYGRTLHDVHPHWAGQVEPVLRRVLDSGAPLLNVAVRAELGSPPAPRAFRVTCYPVTSSEGHLLGVGMLVLDTTDAEHATAELARAADRLHLLSEVGSSLARTLDVERVLHLIAELTVPRLADACAVDLVEDHRVRRVALVDDGALPGDPLPEVLPGALHDPPPQVAQVLASGRPLRLEGIPEGLLDGGAASGVRSGIALVLPLKARGLVLGALTLAAASSGRRFDPADVALAEEVAARSAVAVDNARLYARQRDVAVALQHSLLPQRLPEQPGVEVAARYVAGSADTEVGGDWYDVVPLDGGRVGVVIGDVMGRGVRAAAVMGQLRAAVRAYAVMNLPVGRLVGYLDRVVEALDAVQMVTCLYAELDPRTGEVAYANAGHYPPLLRRADGSVEVLPGEPDPPLGVAVGQPTERRARVPRGGTLVLYTDGLVEERNADPDARIRRLCDTLAGASGSPERLVDALLSGMGRTAAHHDDVALLAVRLGDTMVASAPDVVARLALPGDTAVVRSARQFAADTLQRWGLATLADTVTLLVSEVVTNALKHARSGAELRLHRTATGVEVEVIDPDDRLPSPRMVDADSESGRGLHLVEALAASWGAEPTPSGKRVWFRVDDAA